MIETSIMIGVIMALSELIKKMEIFSPKFIPLINLVLGVIFSVLFNTSDMKMALFKRNRYMVEQSNYCICALLRSFGGTDQTVKYARQKGLWVINVAG